MGIVHLARVSLDKDNVIWLWRVAYRGLGAGGVYHSLRWFLRLLRISIWRTSAILDISRSPEYHSDISSFRCMGSISPNLGTFFLHERAFLAIGLVSACGLATTLDIAIYCNTTIRPKFVRYALVACGVKYVRILATTLSIVICCNTAIRPEFVRYALMTCGQVFVYCSATTLGCVICCDKALGPKFVHCVLAVIRLLPIYRAYFR